MTPLGKTSDGVGVDVVTLRNDSGMGVRVATYGGTIISMRVPDRSGAADDIVLGFDDVATYFTKSPFFGALIGRYGNRIAKGKFTLDGTTLHAGDEQRTESPARRQQGLGQGGLGRPSRSRRATASASCSSTRAPTATRDIPATVNADVTYTLTGRNGFTIDYHATTDKPTVINLTQHTLLQSCRREGGRHSRPRADPQRRPSTRLSTTR